MQNIESLQSHIFEAGTVDVGSSESVVVVVVSEEGSGRVQGVLVKVSVEPGRKSACGEESEDAIVVSDFVKGSVVGNELVASILPPLDLRDVSIRRFSEPVAAAS